MKWRESIFKALFKTYLFSTKNTGDIKFVWTKRPETQNCCLKSSPANKYINQQYDEYTSSIHILITSTINISLLIYFKVLHRNAR